LVLTGEYDHSSRWAAISSVAAKVGCTPETFRSWVKKIEVDSGAGSEETTDPAKRVKELERDNRELKRANEILRRACPTKCFGYS
jgi:transposase-like protein